MPDAAQDLINIMQDDVWKFYKMIHESNETEQNFYKIPILKYIEPSVFVEIIVKMEFYDRHSIGWALTKRYEFSNINEILLPELDWLKSVKDLLLKEADYIRGKLSGYRLELLAKEYFNQAIEKLEKKA